MKEKLMTLPIPTSELTEYKDYIGFLFCNGDNVYNVCYNEEDIIQSNKWFKNYPLRSFMYMSETPIRVGDKFLSYCNNRELNYKIFEFIHLDEECGLVTLKNEQGKEIFTTKYIFKDAIKYIREATMEDKENYVKNQNK